MTADPPGKQRILVADDEPHIGRIIQMKLEQGPFEVILAEDGEAALDAIERDPDIALVVLDLMMPKLSGLDVLARLRATDKTKSLPTVILTAAGEEDQERNAMRLGATEFLTKPFSPKKLYTMVAQLLGVPVAAATGEHSSLDLG
ncbi:MAG: response regulator transcription factor [Gemmatimonadaceae bacterium]|nr:response regulator transcription factor [Gemmatimonadaceae bacterium]